MTLQRQFGLKRNESVDQMSLNNTFFKSHGAGSVPSKPQSTQNNFYQNTNSKKATLYNNIHNIRSSNSRDRLFSFSVQGNEIRKSYNTINIEKIQNSFQPNPNYQLNFAKNNQNLIISNQTQSSSKKEAVFKIKTRNLKIKNDNFFTENLFQTQNNFEQEKNPKNMSQNFQTNKIHKPVFHEPQSDPTIKSKQVPSYRITTYPKLPDPDSKDNTNDFLKKTSFTFEEELGKGSYAVVYLSTERFSQQKFAIKVYKKDRMNTRIRRKIIEDEVQVLQFCNHKNIMKFHRKIETSSEIHLVLELIRGKSLGHLLKNQPGQFLPEHIAKVLLRKILEALIYLHANHVYHRDLKLDNILIKDDLEPVMIDFGFSCISSPNQSLSLFCGTPNYMSPEIVNKKEYFGGPNDAWSFGVLFYRVVVGNFPFASKSTEELNRKINKLEYQIPKSVSSAAKRVIESLFIIEQSQRSSLDKLMTFRFFLGA